MEYFTKVGENRIVKSLRACFRSGWYLAVVVFLMVCANLFSLELFTFWLYLALGALVVLFEDDLRAIIPIVLCCYTSISAKNNPGMFVPDGKENVAAFYEPAFRVQIILLIVLMSILFLARLITILMRREKRPVPALALGFGALGLAFVLGGLFSPFYEWRTALFGFVEVFSLCGLYFFFYYTVDWKNTEKSFFAKLFMAIGFGILVELAGMYVQSGILTDAEVQRGALVTGWGMYNNVGCVLTICLPAPLYFAATTKRGWIFTLIGFLFFFGLVMTQSRGSILFGGIVFSAALVIVIIKSRGRERLWNLVSIGVSVLIAAVVVILLREKLTSIFGGALDHTFDKDVIDGDISNGRFRIYKEGIRQFLKNPFFGVGFYEVDASIVFRWGNLSENAFLPPRYHDTYVQLLASGGIFALICYLAHRLETLVLLFRRPTMEKTFIALCIASFVLTSILDCHFFNLGPGLMYGVLLVCAEGVGKHLTN